MVNGLSLGGQSTGESSLGGSKQLANSKIKLINNLSSAQCLGNVDDIVEHLHEDEEDDEQMEAVVALTCKAFIKSNLYKLLSFAHGYETEEDEEWQREIMDPETYLRLFPQK